MNFLFGFSGRIGRGTWWLIGLINILISALVIGSWMGAMNIFDFSSDHGDRELSNGGISLGIVLLIGIVLGTWTNLAACVKRFHDRDKSGWWFLIQFIPMIGPIWLLVECGLLTGTPGSNSYGPPAGSGSSYDGDDLDAAFERSRTLPVEMKAVAVAAVTAQQQAAPSRKAAPTGFGRRGIA